MQIDLTKLPSEPALLQQAVRELAATLATKNAEIDKLHALIKQLQRSQFGRRSEQLDADQLQLGLEDLEQAVAAVAAAQEAAGPATETSPSRPPTRRNRGALPAHLPRIEVVVDMEDKTCPCCGGALHGDARRRPGTVPGEGDPPAALRLSDLRGRCGPGGGTGAAD